MDATSDNLLCPVLLLDGGLGTSLDERTSFGVLSEETPLWSSHFLLRDPTTIEAVHQSFLRAGADILLTATYQASFDGFACTRRHVRPTSLSDENPRPYSKEEATNAMRLAINLARNAIDRNNPSPNLAKPFPRRGEVALSLGAYGATMVPSQEYSGKYPSEMATCSALRDWHAARLNAFRYHAPTWKLVDYIAFETIRNSEEVRAVKNVMAGLRDEERRPWWMCCVVPDDLNPKVEQELRDVVRAMLATGDIDEDYHIQRDHRPWGIGVNCVAVHKLQRIVEIFEEEVNRECDGTSNSWQPWLVIYPDGTRDFEHYDSESRQWVGAKSGPEAPHLQALKWASQVWNVVQKARDKRRWPGILVGGCCRTNFSHIQQLKHQLSMSGVSAS